MLLAASADLIAVYFKMSLNDVAYVLRVLIIFGPILGFIITKRSCLALQRKDREIALHGRETGVIEFSSEGAILERHELVDQYRLYALVAFEFRHPVSAQLNKKLKAGTWVKFRSFWFRRFYEDGVEPIFSRELNAAHSEQIHH